ncbi:hypothetical protein PIB30_064002 [Stylosanthes scabra]|uniref:Uncharacterized protein n=1 Tax=Stylosanthes scabra TaxID=79078 RepID=A0ABU6WMN6_9FABA|nr:hypothetical protein [Stylosanthes scabra]
MGAAHIGWGRGCLDVTSISASTIHDIEQGFKQRRDQAHGLGGVGAYDPSVGYHHMPPQPGKQYPTPPQYPMQQHFPLYLAYHSPPSYNQAGPNYSSQPPPSVPALLTSPTAALLFSTAAVAQLLSTPSDVELFPITPALPVGFGSGSASSPALASTSSSRQV